MKTITFNAQLANTHRRIHSISGRLGDFIFRTYKNGKIIAYYKPKYLPFSSLSRPNFEALSNQLREITSLLALSIININYYYDE